MHRIAVLALDEAIVLDLAIPTQVFGLARLTNGQRAYEIRVCGPGAPPSAAATCPGSRCPPPFPCAKR